MKDFRLFPFFIGIAILLIDAISKYYIQSNLPAMDHYSLFYPYGGIGIFSDFMGIEFSITHATNRGAAWGILGEWQLYLLFVRILIVACLLAYLLFFNKRKAWTIPLVFISAGALGNVLDYFLYGHVVDMFRFVFWGYDYPIFNVADSAIFLGIGWILILSFLEPKAQTTRSAK